MEKAFQFFVYFLTISTLRYFVIAGVAFLIVYKIFVKLLANNKIQERKAGLKDFKREIIHSVKSNFLMVLIALPFMLPPLKKYTLMYDQVATMGWGYLLVSVLLGLVIHDTYFYWAHRLLHHRNVFNKVHLLHHKSTNPSPWTSYAFSSFEAITEGLILPVLLFVLPMHPLAITLFITAAFVINVYGHLGYEIAPRWFRQSFLFEVLNTSVHHNLHHSKFKGNYGLYFRVWDRLMKTENPAYVSTYDKIQEQRFGVNTGESDSLKPVQFNPSKRA